MRCRVNSVQVSQLAVRDLLSKPELLMYTQTEYGMAYALIFGLIVLGLLVVCVPRPRKKDLFDPKLKKKRRKRGSAY